MYKKAKSMRKFRKIVNEVIDNSDLILMIIDARKIKESINKKIESRIIKKKKSYLYVINKVDLLSKNEQKRIRLKNSIEISAKKHIGTLKLLKKIKEIAKGKQVTVGIVGYPNTGKSTIINALKGRHSAPTSPVSGYTKGLQKLRIDKQIMMLDTPGVFSYDDKDHIENVMIGAIDADQMDDPESTAIELIEKSNGLIEKYFEVKKSKDPLKTLETIAIKKNIIKKGNLPDTVRMGKEIIRLYQIGKIR